MALLSTKDSLRVYYGRESVSSLKALMFNSSATPFSIRDRLTELQAIDSARVLSCWERALEYFLEFHNSFIVMNDVKKQQVRDRYYALVQIIANPMDAGYQHEYVAHDIIGFPRLPELRIPGAINISDVGKFVLDKLKGTIGNYAQTIYEIVVGIPEELFFIIESFATRISQFGELLLDGKVDKALGKLLESVALLIRDCTGSTITIVANAVNDVVCGLIGGLLTARSLTQAEINFAQSIFHDLVFLEFVQVSPYAMEDKGMVAGSTIFVDGGIDLNNLKSRVLFAHEMTHVWQSQLMGGAGSRTATKEQLSHWFGGPDPYKLPAINNNTRWETLGAEQRAEVVAVWQYHADTAISNRFPYESRIPRGQEDAFKRLVDSVGLF